MHTIFRCQLCHLAVVDVDAIDMPVQRVVFVAFDDDALLLSVESEDVLHHPRTTGELTQQFSLLII